MLKATEMTDLDRENNFNALYNNLDKDTQVKLDHFIAGIEEVGQNFIGETIYKGSKELLDRFMPCLQAISPSIYISMTNIDDNNHLHKLNWEPNDFTIIQDVLVRAYA
jgi:hypothetical protein